MAMEMAVNTTKDTALASSLMAKIRVDQVADFQKRFLDLLRAAHQDDVIRPLGEGKIDDSIENIIRETAQNVCNAIA